MNKNENGGANDKPANQSIPKVLQLITYLAESRSPLRLYEIAYGTRLPQATALRYLNTLMAEGYVYMDELSARYALTWKFCDIGDQIRLHSSLRAISGDVVTRLSEKLPYGICLVIEQNMECMYLDCLYQPTEMGFTLVRIGKQTPMHAVSSGKMLLTQYSEEQIDELIEKKGLCALTDRTITGKAALLCELDRVRSQGFAMDDEECEPGLRCVAVPIRGYGNKITAAISVFGAAQKLTDDCICNTILPALRDAADQISFRIGCKGNTPNA